MFQSGNCNKVENCNDNIELHFLQHLVNLWKVAKQANLPMSRVIPQRNGQVGTGSTLNNQAGSC